MLVWFIFFCHPRDPMNLTSPVLFSPELRAKSLEFQDVVGLTLDECRGYANVTGLGS